MPKVGVVIRMRVRIVHIICVVPSSLNRAFSSGGVSTRPPLKVEAVGLKKKYSKMQPTERLCLKFQANLTFQ